MTHEPVNDVQGDIAYMKSLAAEGRQAPIMVGPILVAAAIVFGAATLGQWLVVLGQLPLQGWGVLSMWIASGLVFAAALFVLIGRTKAQAGSQTKDNVAISAAWSSCGYTIFGFWGVLMAFGFSTNNWSSMALMPSVVMVAYGAAWLIAGQIVRQGWMVLVGVISFVGALALGWFAFTTLTYGIYLLLLVAVALLPGLHLMKLAARAKV